MSRHAVLRVLVALALVLVAGAVWAASNAQRRAADHGFAEIRAAERMRTGLLEQSIALDAYAVGRRPGDLAAFGQARREFEVAAVGAGNDLHGSAERKDLAPALAAGRTWQALAERELAALRAAPGGPASGRTASGAATSGRSASSRAGLARAAALDRFAAASDSFIAEREADRRDAQRDARSLSLAAIAGLALALAGLAYFVDRRATAERRRRAGQRRFVEVLQLARSEGEAYDVIKRHLERVLRGTTATVLNRNHADDRLEARTPVPEGSPLGEALREARPGSCVAIRAGRPHAGEDGGLMTCQVCGAEPGATSCVPSLVGGAVVGSVLVQRAEPLTVREQEQLRVTVADSAPVVANLRNLALAETRAATDALTGLANARALHETIKRMVAQASRAATPLAAILFDLDHFKQINDTYGHDGGDTMLAAVADAAAASLRASDFLGRYGGEEFLVLLPDTSRKGAMEVAEKLRAAIGSLKVQGIDRGVTASFGVATLPEDAGDSAELLRVADRALYTAKAAGRDRVETARLTAPFPVPVSAA